MRPWGGAIVVTVVLMLHRTAASDQPVHEVQIVASKGDLTVQDQQGTTTVQEGQQTTRDDTSNPEKKKKKKRRGAGAATAAGGGILSSSTAVYTGLAIVGGVTTWVLLQGDDPLSPACPNNTCP